MKEEAERLLAYQWIEENVTTRIEVMTTKELAKLFAEYALLRMQNVEQIKVNNLDVEAEPYRGQF